MDKLKALYKDYAEELLYKVQWPSFEDLQSSTITVLIASLITALLDFTSCTLAQIKRFGLHFGKIT